MWECEEGGPRVYERAAYAVAPGRRIIIRPVEATPVGAYREMIQCVMLARENTITSSMRKLPFALLVLAALIASAENTDDLFVIVNLRQLASGVWVLKLQNPRTGAFRDATVSAELARTLRPQQQVRLTSAGVMPLALSRRCGETTADGLYVARIGHEEVQYTLIHLGGTGLVARCRWNGADTDLEKDIAARTTSVKRNFKFNESAFDHVVGKRWNWVGSDNSGGKKTNPGGLGPVDVECINPFDCHARRHDVQFWLSLNFEKGARISLGEQKRPYTVEDQDTINNHAIDLFVRSAQVTIQNALAAKTDARTGAPINVEFMNHLRAELQGNNPVAKMTAVAAVIDKLQPFFPPKKPADIWP